MTSLFFNQLGRSWRALAFAVAVFGAAAAAASASVRARADVAPLPAEFTAIQRAFFHHAHRDFLRGLVSALPEAQEQIGAIREPVFDPGLSRNEWLQVFIERALSVLVDAQAVTTADVPRLRTMLEDKFFSYHNDEGFARFAYLQVYQARGAGRATPVMTIEELALPAAYPRDHTLDLDGYVGERFPKELQAFIRASRAELYFDDSSCEDAFTAQKREGFDRAVRFMGKLDNPDSQFFFALNREFGRVRFVACEMAGRDARTRLAKMIGPAFTGRSAVVVKHQKPQPILFFTDEGDKLSLDGLRDRVVIGFQNTVWWFLKTKAPAAWVRANLSLGGADVAVFRNRQSGERILSVANVYGDEMSQALGILYGRGLRRFLYLGTGGGLGEGVKIGDVLLPRAFVKPDGSTFDFQNHLSTRLVLPEPRRIHHESRQGWVATLVDETKSHMLEMKASGLDALDIESRYFAEFFLSHPAREAAVVITISDLPLGEMNYNQSSATRSIPMDSITRVIDQIL